MTFSAKGSFMKFIHLCVAVSVAVSVSGALGSSSHVCAQTKAAAPSQAQAAKSFVQSFYTWYTPHANSNEHAPTDVYAVQQKKSSFSAELYKQLKEDSDAQAKVKDEIVGLDFDPFLNAQDVSTKYVVGNVVAKKDRYLVDVHSVSNGKKSAKPDVVPEVALTNGKWTFVNFHYGKTEFPENENLLSVLKVLRESRAKYK